MLICLTEMRINQSESSLTYKDFLNFFLISTNQCNIRPEEKISTENRAKLKNDRTTVLYMLFTVCTKASSFGGLSNFGSTKTLLFSGFDQNAQNNLLTCEISELTAGSQYPQTTRSLLKTELLLLFIL